MSKKKRDQSEIFSAQGRRLRQIRGSLALNQADLASRLGITTDRWGRAERGENPMPPEILQALAETLDIDVAWVLTGEGTMFRGPLPAKGQEQLAAEQAEAGDRDLADRLLAAHERVLEVVARLRGEPPAAGWTPVEVVEPGYIEVGAESVEGRPDILASHVPIIDAVAAGAAREAGLADAYPPGWAESFVEFEAAPAGAFAVRVAGASMEPEYRDGDLVIVDPRRAADPGDAAVVVYENPKTGCRLGRLKRLVRRGRLAILESSNPAFPAVEVPAKAVLAAYKIFKHLPRVRRRPGPGA